ncbi:DNA-directed RNA polymerase subunit alpha [Candidatus Dependentiae bacterium]
MEGDKKEYQPLIIPRLSWDKKKISETYGELIAQPLEPGFGNTLGNALRRALLGAVEGSAVTSVIIKGINNEFSSVDGVVEDAMQLVLNIKEIVVKNKTGQPGKMSLKVSGEAAARVSDIKSDDHLELINKDHVLAHVADGGELDIEFFVESGRGYRSSQWPQGKALQDDNRIYIDAMFSPLSKVMFNVEKTRVGKEIDYDKLTLKIYTDGSENPVDALHYAVSVLRTQLECFLISTEIPFNEISAMPDKEQETEPLELDQLGLKGVPVELLMKPIDELELSVRAHNCLINAGVKTILDLVNLQEEDVLKIKNFGRKSLNEVKASMKAFGLTYDMAIKEEDIKKILQSRMKKEKKDS